jgi:hypothetical protein
MSNFDDRVMRLINDRVNDLERLFLASENHEGGVDPDCCEDIARKINVVNKTVGDINNTVKELRNLYYQDNSIHLGDLIWQPSGSEDDDPNDDGLDHEHGNLPGWLESGIPPTLKDILELLTSALGGQILIRNLPRFTWWLLRHVPDLLSWRTILPLLGLVASLWRGLGDRVDHNQDVRNQWDIENKIKDLNGKLDDIAKLLAEVAASGTSGGDTSILLDRLQQFLDDLTAYYQILAGLGRQSIDLENEHYTAIIDLLNLMRGDTAVTDSNIACLEQWLKGSRSCEEFTTDVITMLEGARDCCNYVKCHLDDYYQDIISRMDTNYRDLRDRLIELKSGCDQLRHIFEDPHSPIEDIQDSIEHGNVVGTGSLVLNYANDLNVIKSMLVDIRRLL